MNNQINEKGKVVLTLLLAVTLLIPGVTFGEENYTISGVVEIEAGIDNNTKSGFGFPDSSDIVLATVELGIDAEINDKVTGHVLFLYEEDETAFDVDEGTISIATPNGLVITAGKMYVPFGAFNSHFISDPLTLELGETNETGILLSYGNDQYEVSFGTFNGDVREANKNDRVDDMVASVTFNASEGVSLGASYISDITDSDADITGAAAGSGTLTETASGMSAFASLTFGEIAVELEYLAADQIKTLDGDGDGKGDEPTTFNVEVAYSISDSAEVALRYETSDEFFGQPEAQYGLVYSRSLYENTGFALEYLHGTYDKVADSDNERNLITAQLAVEF